MSAPRSSARSPIAGWGRWAVIAGMAAGLWAAPAIAAACWSTTRWHPGAHLGSTVAAYQHLFTPEQIPGSGMSDHRFAITVLAVLAVATVAGVVVTARLVRRRSAVLRGLAAGRDLDRFSARAIVARSKVILGAHDKVPAHAGLRLGHEKYTGRPIWILKDSNVLVVAPPQSGKTSGTVAPAIVDHHGPVVATGVRDDILNWTLPWRAAGGGPLWLCEPMRTSGALPAGVQAVRWSPLAGCHDMVDARLRAEALFSALPKGGANDEYWRNAGQDLLAALLMAAARDDGRIGDVVAWLDRDSDASPVEILRNIAATLTDPDDAIDQSAIGSVASQLEAAIAQDPRYRAGVTGQALQAVAPFRLPAIRRMCDVPIETSFDPTGFLKESGTIWMLGSESHQRQAAGVCTALTAAIVEAARALARAQGGRLRPPLLVALDEAVNVAPIPRLEQLLATGGGSGIQTMVVLQSMAAARHTWGTEMGDALLDFNNVKVILGGLSDAKDLQDLSTLLGQRDEVVAQASRSGRAGMFDPGDQSWSWRQVPVMRPDEIRELDSQTCGEALLIARSAKGVLLRQPRIYNRTPPILATNPTPAARRRARRLNAART